MNNQHTPEDKNRCTLNDAELLKAAHKAISDMCQRQRWQMTVPVDFNRDSDMLLAEVCNRYNSLLKENESLKAEREEYRERYECNQATVVNQQSIIGELKTEVERLNSSVSKQKVRIIELKEQLSSQKAINKEMVEVIKDLIKIYQKYANDDPYEDHKVEHAKALISKQEQK